MTHCSAGVKRGRRRSDGDGDVARRRRAGHPVHQWPRRQFRLTRPATYTREADLNMICIGKAERFEIPDALPFGG